MRCACGHRVCGVFRHWGVFTEAGLDHDLPGRSEPWHAEIQEWRPPAADVSPLLVLPEGKMWRQEYGSQLSIYVCWPPGWRWEAASSSWAPPPGGGAAAGRGSAARCARRTRAASAPRCCRSPRSTPAATLRTNTLCYANTVRCTLTDFVHLSHRDRFWLKSIFKPLKQYKPTTSNHLIVDWSSVDLISLYFHDF